MKYEVPEYIKCQRINIWDVIPVFLFTAIAAISPIHWITIVISMVAGGAVVDLCRDQEHYVKLVAENQAAREKELEDVRGKSRRSKRARRPRSAA